MSIADSRKFQALTHPFQINPSVGRFRKERNYATHIQGMIVQILMTAPAERVHRARFGAGLRSFVFAPLHEASMQLVEARAFSEIEEWLGNYLHSITVKARSENENTLKIEITYFIRDTGQNEYLEFEVKI